MNKYIWVAIIGVIYLALFGPLLAGAWWFCMLCFWIFEGKYPDPVTYNVIKDIDK
jgi:hypothetical protein